MWIDGETRFQLLSGCCCFGWIGGRKRNLNCYAIRTLHATLWKEWTFVARWLRWEWWLWWVWRLGEFLNQIQFQVLKSLSYIFIHFSTNYFQYNKYIAQKFLLEVLKMIIMVESEKVGDDLPSSVVSERMMVQAKMSGLKNVSLSSRKTWEDPGCGEEFENFRVSRSKAKLQLTDWMVWVWESPGWNANLIKQREEREKEVAGTRGEWAEAGGAFAAKLVLMPPPRKTFLSCSKFCMGEENGQRRERGTGMKTRGQKRTLSVTVEEQEISVTDAILWFKMRRKKDRQERNKEGERKKRQGQEEKKRELTQRSYPGHLVISGESPRKGRNSSPSFFLQFQVSSLWSILLLLSQLGMVILLGQLLLSNTGSRA